MITHAKGWDDGRQSRRPVLVRVGVSPSGLLLRAPQKLGPEQVPRPTTAGQRLFDTRASADLDELSNGTNGEIDAKRKRARVDDEPHPHEGGRASDKKPREYKQRKKTASRRHKLGAKARKRAKAREAKEAAG